MVLAPFDPIRTDRAVVAYSTTVTTT